MKLNEPVTILKGIGQKKSIKYGRLDIVTIKDLIEYYPRSYEIGVKYTQIGAIKVGVTCMVKGKIIQKPVSIRRGRLVITTTKILDETGEIKITWFNKPYLSNQLIAGTRIFIKGKATIKYGVIQFDAPKILGEKERAYLADKNIVPIYPKGKGLSQREIRLAIKQSIDYAKDEMEELLPKEIIKSYNLITWVKAVLCIHYPENEKEIEQARRRIVFDEFLIFQLGLLTLRDGQLKNRNTTLYKKEDLYKRLRLNLSYVLTNAQDRVITEIIDDLKCEYAMNRLVQGDVGSGKTIIAALAIGLTKENGYQSAFMVPTEVLAKQHYKSLLNMFEMVGITLGLLVGSLSKKQKEEVYNKLKNGELDVIIGTHAIIQEGVEFKNLALVITDEQHRFGVRQREVLAEKGEYPNILVMSATPIPRTLALMLYGDMDISIIDEMPPGRQVIETYSVSPDYHLRIYKFIREKIEKGEQCYIICPKVDEDEEGILTDVVTYTEIIRENMPKDSCIKYLHGKLNSKEKNSIMESFVKGEIDILVSTTVIEVGVNVPNATVIVIENAERFGLAQLHQLRGRVGRGETQSYCILIAETKTDNSKKRMELMSQVSDGFIIAEKDLELRGHGDLMGTRQSGVPLFKLANIIDDYSILKETNKLAKIIKADKANLYKNTQYRRLRLEIENYIKDKMLYIV